jgi:phage recombination protein Bet
MNSLVKQETGALAISEDDLLRVLQSSLYPGAAPASIKLVIGYCKAAGLDPMQKPVHIVPMWDSKAGQMRDVVMPGVGLYRTQAARTGCAGISEPEFGPDRTESIGGQSITFPVWCRVTVKRRQSNGAVDEFTAREFWAENYAVKGGKEKSVAPNAMWTKRPYGQLAKCAEAQALRKAFPEIGSQPAAEEMEGKTIEGEYIDAGAGDISRGRAPAAARQELPAYAQADFEKNLPAWAEIVHQGKKTPGDLLAMLCTRATFSEDQKAALLSLKKMAEPEPAATQQDPWLAAYDATATTEGAQQ